MKRFFVLSLALFLSAIALIGFVPPVFADTYSVSITATQFIPSTLTVAAGDTIRFINTSSATQSAKTSLASGFNTGNIGPGESKSIVVSTAGTYTYTSQYTPTMSGTVIITAASGSSTLTTQTSTTSTTTTSQPANTQKQPVSGTTEILFGLIVLGAGFLFVGGITQRYSQQAPQITTVDLPSVTLTEEPAE